ncbi:MAG: hypothetical protein A2149_09280 [Candidatus Schekmanbacteria bacterium RBG_16_38_11]|uniref:Uncharacterized protein n=2 Tax=Candidatus Schekmaniibacteriota TaxID=1817811 RepID=A0A1F7R9J5_9BACT|nr:MAG: hypothetical protein A2042_06220 [Candidatus Schekmanbacteria bacterium GWA2_38_11]OGL45173.1 MAG: hypothetical protein A2149_09280 [Candidatus Schekmanbacteria bacterium RBG_16_38_11]
MKTGLVLLISVLICSYFLVKYIRLVLINSNCRGFKKSAREIYTLLREEPLFLTFYFGFIILLSLIGLGLASLINLFLKS